MRRAVVRCAEAVYNFTTRRVDASWTSWPFYAVSTLAAKLADTLDPIPTHVSRDGVSGS